MNDELRTKLWDYCYGLLDAAEAEALRAEITSDRELAKAYARVKLQTELVASAARASRGAEQWRSLPEAHGLVPESSRRNFARDAAWFGSLALSLLLLVYAGSAYFSGNSLLRDTEVAVAWEEQLAAHPRLLVTGPTVVNRGDAAEYEIRVKRLDETPLETSIDASISDLDGATVWNETAGVESDGGRRLRLPTDFDSDALFLKIAIPAAAPAQQAAEFSSWIAVDDSPRSPVVAIDQIAQIGPDRALVRTIELSDHFAESSLPELHGGGKTQLEARADGAFERPSDSLADDRQRVWWGLQLLEEQPAVAFAYRDKPLDNKLSMRFATESEREEGVQRADDASAVADADLAVAQPPVANSGDTMSAAPAAGATTNNAPAEPQLQAQGQADALTEPELQAASGSLSVPRVESVAPLLVEGIYVNGDLAKNRFIASGEDETGLLLRAEASKLSETDDFGRVERRVWDYSEAPPRLVEQETTEVAPTIQPLQIEVRFDRGVYHAEEPVVAEIRTTDETGAPVQAVLGVRIDGLTASEADMPLQVAAPIDSQTYAIYSTQTAGQTQDASPPLLFDNAGQQQERLRRSMEQWLDERSAARRRLALTLLVWSSAGGLLVAALVAFRSLSLQRAAFPAALLACTLLAGVWWLTRPRETAPRISVEALQTFGVSTEPPAPTSIPLDRLADGRQGLSVDKNEALFRLRGSRFAEALAEHDFAPTQEAVVDEKLMKLAANGSPVDLPAAAHWYEMTDSLAVNGQQAVAQQHQLALGNMPHYWHYTEQERLSRGLPRLETRVARPAAPSSRASQRTVYWHPLITTNAAGVARVSFDVPAAPLSYRLVVQGHQGRRYAAASENLPTAVRFLPR